MTADEARRVWNPTEYMRRSKDPGQSRLHMKAIEVWRENALSAFPTDLNSREAIKLEAHFRHMVMAFMGAEPLREEKDVGNAIMTALAGTLGVVMTDAVVAGMDRMVIINMILERANAVVDYEINRLKQEAARGPNRPEPLDI